MWSPSSKSTGWRWPLWLALVCCFALGPVGTFWAQSSPESVASLPSSSDFLAAVQSLSDSMTPAQREQLTTVLLYYKGQLEADKKALDKQANLWTEQSKQLTKLSKSLEAERGQTLGTEIVLAMLGYAAGYFTPHK